MTRYSVIPYLENQLVQCTNLDPYTQNSNSLHIPLFLDYPSSNMTTITCRGTAYPLKPRLSKNCICISLKRFSCLIQYLLHFLYRWISLPKACSLPDIQEYCITAIGMCCRKYSYYERQAFTGINQKILLLQIMVFRTVGLDI